MSSPLQDPVPLVHACGGLRPARRYDGCGGSKVAERPLPALPVERVPRAVHELPAAAERA